MIEQAITDIRTNLLAGKLFRIVDSNGFTWTIDFPLLKRAGDYSARINVRSTNEDEYVSNTVTTFSAANFEGAVSWLAPLIENGGELQ